MKRFLFTVGTLGCLSSLAIAATSLTVSPQAVWKESATLSQQLQKCTDLSATDPNVCLCNAMKAAGASPEAIAFARSMKDDPAWVQAFRESGRVDIAGITYPFHANENQGILLVNGTPSPIDVDLLEDLPQGDLEKNSTYSSLKKRFPEISIWPGDRYHLDAIAATNLPDGGQRFSVPFILRNGCHACEEIGAATFGFDFASNGKFSGIKLVTVSASKGKPGK